MSSPSCCEISTDEILTDAATGFDAPFDSLGTVKEREPAHYTRKADDIFISLASSNWASDYSIRPTYDRLLAQADDVGVAGRLMNDLPVDALDLSGSDLFAVRFSSKSDVER